MTLTVALPSDIAKALSQGLWQCICPSAHLPKGQLVMGAKASATPGALRLSKELGAGIQGRSRSSPSVARHTAA